MNIFEKLARSIAGIVVVLLFLTMPAFAQLPVGSITGTVGDASGAMVPGANVTATNRETGLIRTTVTGNSGRFVLPALPVGEYNIKAEAPAFAGQVRQNVVVTIGQESVINFALAVGSVSEAVTITADVPLVETTTGALGGLVDEQRVQELPLKGRNFNELVLLQTGINVHKQVSTTSSTGTGLVFSSNGAPIRSNFMTLDGANLASAEGLTGVSVTGSMLGIDGIQEYRVITNSFPAEYGMAMGSQITVATKSGTNKLRGSLFEFLRNDATDARDFFDVEVPSFQRNNFGGSIGGPIRTDKAFFFLTYEGNRERQGQTQVLQTITADARVDGFFRNAQGQPINISPVVKPYLALYPLPTDQLSDSSTTGVARYKWVFKKPVREDFGQARYDHNFSEKDSFFTRYTVSDSVLTDAAENWPDFPRSGTSRGQFLTVAESHTLSPAMLNQMRASFSRTFGRFDSPSFDDPKLEFFPGKGMGSVSPGSGVTAFGPSTPWIIFNQNLYTVSNDVYYTRASHSIKFGTLLNRYQVYTEPTTSRRGTWSYANLVSFIQGIPRQFVIETPGSNTYRHYKWYTLGFYVQDDWRATQRLTLNLGLRYETHTTVNEQNNRGSHFDNLNSDANPVIEPALFENPSKKNFGPRVGFAWDVAGNAKTSIRGGFGLLYDIANMAAAAQVNATASPPFSSRSTVTYATTARDTALQNPVIPDSARGRGIRVADYHMQQPHMLHYNLTVDRQLPASVSLSVAYVATRGINLYQTKEGNPTVPGGIPQNGVCVARPAGQEYVTNGPKCWLGTESRLNSNIADAEFKTAAGDSWYNGLQMSIKKNMGNRLTLQSSYTYGKNLDTTQGQKGGEAGGASNTGVDPDNPAVDKGPSDSDTRHNWTINGLYRLPVPDYSGIQGALLSGWRLSSIFSARSGLPFTPLLSGNRSRSNVAAGAPDRPDLLPGFSASDIILGGPDQYFNTAAFGLPAAGFLGSSGRNQFAGPGQVNLDFSLAKEFKISALGEAGRADFRFEVFNIFNHPNFNIPVGGRTVYTATATSPNPAQFPGALLPSQVPAANIPGGAALIDRTRGDPRKIQFGLKLNF